MNLNLGYLMGVFLQKDKDCFKEYIGWDLSLGGRTKVDFFGISKSGDEKIIHFIIGRFKQDNKKDFFKFYEKALSLKEYADNVYVFDYYSDDFKENNKIDIDLCKTEGIGIILCDGERIYEFLKPQKNKIDSLNKKDVIFRAFLKNVEIGENGKRNYIADIVFQATYELTRKRGVECAKFGDVYDNLFSEEGYKKILNKALPGKHVLNESGMLGGFNRAYERKIFIRVLKHSKTRENKICFNEHSLEKSKNPILLD